MQREIRHSNASIELRDDFSDDACPNHLRIYFCDFILDTGANTTVVNHPDALVQDVHHSRVDVRHSYGIDGELCGRHLHPT
jgi:hypothetical protein